MFFSIYHALFTRLSVLVKHITRKNIKKSFSTTSSAKFCFIRYKNDVKFTTTICYWENYDEVYKLFSTIIFINLRGLLNYNSLAIYIITI